MDKYKTEEVERLNKLILKLPIKDQEVIREIIAIMICLPTLSKQAEMALMLRRLGKRPEMPMLLRELRPANRGG